MSKATTDPVLDEFDFSDQKPREKVVKYQGKTYLLREASEGTAVHYKNLGLTSTRIIDGKLSGFGNAADSEPILLSECLFIITSVGETTLDNVPVSVVRTWPRRIVKPLIKWIKSNSDLDDDQSPESIRSQIDSLKKRLTEAEKVTADPKDDISDMPPISG